MGFLSPPCEAIARIKPSVDNSVNPFNPESHHYDILVLMSQLPELQKLYFCYLDHSAILLLWILSTFINQVSIPV